MDITINEPVEQQNIEESPKRYLLETAKDIQEYRLETLSPEAKINSVLRKIFTLNDIKNDLAKEDEELETKYGALHEALFYINLKQLGIPITVSNDYDDTKGIDFRICNKPVDVTINPIYTVLQEKIVRDNATILSLPIYIGQQSVMQFGNGCTILQSFIDGRLIPQDYLYQIIKVNRDLERIMIANKQNQTDLLQGYILKGVTNRHIHNLQNTLGYLSRVLEKFQ